MGQRDCAGVFKARMGDAAIILHYHGGRGVGNATPGTFQEGSTRVGVRRQSEQKHR